MVISALQHAGIDAQQRPADGAGFGAALPTLESPAVWVRRDDAMEARAIIGNAGEGEIGRLSLAGETDGAIGLSPGEEEDGSD